MNTNDTMNIAVYTLTSELHDEHAVAAVTKEFLTNLGFDHELRGADYDDYGTHSLDLIYVRRARATRWQHRSKSCLICVSRS